jgi:putative inorganic carbon (HCO3(-)) transporter
MADSGVHILSSRPRLQTFPEELAASALAASLQPFHFLIRVPALLFLATLSVFVFRPPDLELHHLDRVAFVVLLACVLMRALLLKQRLPWRWSLSAPMAGLLLLSLYTPLTQPYDAQTWSLLAAKIVVPFTLFHLAQLVFFDDRALLQFEWFSLLVLGYLTVVAIASLVGATWLIFPKYILNESLGIHADRARGPFLQAVANGMALNLLGLLALDSWRRRQLRGPVAIFLAFVPIAILATMTRAVWLSFAASTISILIIARDSRVRRACAGLAFAAAIGIIFALSVSGCRLALRDRLEEQSPVEFRLSIYEVSWDMIWEKPWLGWGQNRMPAEIAKRMSDYRPDSYCAHSSYLEILIEQGFVGLALYIWMIAGLLRLGAPRANDTFGIKAIDNDFRRLWVVMLGVYLLNGAFVVVNYQFINAFLFTVGGIVAAKAASSRNALRD